MWHRYEGVPVRLDYAHEVLESLHALWNRPVHLETYDEDKAIVISYDGEGHKQEERSDE